MQTVFQSSPEIKMESFYLLPVGGTAMATLAGLLQAAGHGVSGVDTALYPPMSTLLEELGIPVRIGWDPSAIPPVDRIIIGNAVGRQGRHPRQDNDDLPAGMDLFGCRCRSLGLRRGAAQVESPVLPSRQRGVDDP